MAHKKLLHYGWSTKDTQYVRNFWAQMETIPLDGVMINWPINGNNPYSGGTFYRMDSAKSTSDAILKVEVMQ